MPEKARGLFTAQKTADDRLGYATSGLVIALTPSTLPTPAKLTQLLRFKAIILMPNLFSYFDS